ncbi:MAG: hypothetical protein BGN92_02830 [Sphingobacteriales bacterium 41-5]|nr:MAG: hypothetical protein BGN92_02830 [Sphingobacteriales bacterium 41-5]
MTPTKISFKRSVLLLLGILIITVFVISCNTGKKSTKANDPALRKDTVIILPTEVMPRPKDL